MMLIQSLPLMKSPDPDLSDGVLLMTTGLSRDDRSRVSQWIKVLGWTQVDEYTCQGELQ